jgi:hypothetical protein
LTTDGFEYLDQESILAFSGHCQNGIRIGQMDFAWLRMMRLYYFAPDTLKWEPCGFAYSQFIVWSLGSKLDAFYENFRWAGWQDEVRELSGDRTFFFYPFLWAVGPSLAERHRGTVPVEETYGLSVGGVAQPH